jgi:hypothetical protein
VPSQRQRAFFELDAERAPEEAVVSLLERPLIQANEAILKQRSALLVLRDTLVRLLEHTLCSSSCLVRVRE